MLFVNEKYTPIKNILNHVSEAKNVVSEADNSWGEKFESIICDAMNNRGKIPGGVSKYTSDIEANMTASPEEVYANIYNSLKDKTKGFGEFHKLANSDVEVSDEWRELGMYDAFKATPNKTPKTDIISGNNKYRISIKSGVGARLMSGAICETIATLRAAATGDYKKTFDDLFNDLLSSGAKTRARIHGSTSAILKKLKGKDTSEDEDESAILRINAVKSRLDDLMKTAEGKLREDILMEATTGDVKFGEGNPGSANFVLIWNPNNGICELYKAKEYVDKFGSNYAIRTAYKSSSVKLRDPKTGEEYKTGDYDTWMVLSIVDTTPAPKTKSTSKKKL
jgi:hypothetical protein